MIRNFVLISTNFCIKTVEVTKPLVSGIFYQYLLFLSLNLVCLCCIDLSELKYQECSYLFTFGFSMFTFVFLTTYYLLHHLFFFFFSRLQEQ